MNFKERAAELRDLLTCYQRAYYTTGRALVSDVEYDRLFDELVRIEQSYPELKTEDSPTQRVGSDLSSDFPEVEHSIPVLSLDKAYSAEEILKFISKTRKEGNSSFVMEEKIDGFSMVLYYKSGILQRAVTRGNGAVGNDVTANVKTIHSVPLKLTKPVDIAVRGEIYLPKADFETINNSLSEPYANPRNLAAGTIRRNKSSETARVPLQIFCYEGFWEKNTPFTDHIQILSELKSLGFRVDPNISFYSASREESELRLKQAGLEGKALCFDDMASDIKDRTSGRESLPYEIDGLVVKVNEISRREEMGYTEHHPRWAIAYKFEAPQAESVVLGIDVQIGRTGRVTPMARIKETELSGSVIKNITLHNQDYVDELELAVGDTVAISKRGDVIPAVESVTEKNNSGNTTWQMPDECPICHSKIEKRGAHNFCTNRFCPAQEKGKLEFFCAKKQMDIEGLGPQTLEILYEKGYIRNIEDIYSFDFTQILRDRIPGFGEKKVNLIIEGIKQSKEKDFAHVLVSLGVPELGKKAVELLLSNGFDSMDKVLQASADREKGAAAFSEIEGIGTVIALSIIDGLNEPDVLKTIECLRVAGLNFCSDAASEIPSDLPLLGQSWCVTGTFKSFQPRDKAMELIKKFGGKEVSAVSSKTTCLLAGENAGSKLAKAQALGVRVVTEDVFLSMIEGFSAVENPSVQNDVQDFQPSLF